MKNVVHQAHESGWSIGNAERQYNKLVMDVMSSKYGFTSVFILYYYLVVTEP